MSLTENMDKGRLPFKCPNRKCGKTGWVPISQLDRQLMCRACRSRFHLDPIGKEMVLGDRPNKVVSPLYMAPPEKFKPDLVERSSKRWSALSPRTKRGVKAGIGIVVLVLIGLMVRPMFRSRPKFPKDLAARSMIVVRALGTNNRDRLATIAAPGTEGDADRWIIKARPKRWPKSLAILQAEANVLYQNPRKGRACVAVEIIEPAALAAPPQPESRKAIELADPPEDGRVMPEEGEVVAQDQAASEESEAAPAPVDNESAADGQDIEELPKPAPPLPKLKVRLFWAYAEGQWLFDGTETLKAAKLGD